MCYGEFYWPASWLDMLSTTHSPLMIITDMEEEDNQPRKVNNLQISADWNVDSEKDDVLKLSYYLLGILYYCFTL